MKNVETWLTGCASKQYGQNRRLQRTSLKPMRSTVFSRENGYVGTGPFFTEQARAAAAVARRRRAELKIETFSEFEAFAVRTGTHFTWEIRQYGGVVLVTDDQPYTTSAEARAAGRAVLPNLHINSITSADTGRAASLEPLSSERPD